MSERKMLSLKEKIDILNGYKNENTLVRVLAKRQIIENRINIDKLIWLVSIRFDIGKTQTSLIVRNKEGLKARSITGENINSEKNFINSKGKNIDAMVYDWFCKVWSQNTPLLGPIVQEKAREIALSLGVKDLAASNRWQQRFRSRHNIAFRCIWWTLCC